MSYLYDIILLTKIYQNMKTLEKHNAEIKKSNYSGVTTRFSAYIQFDEIHTDESHDIVGYTTDKFKKAVEIIKSDNYLYARHTRYGINLYGRNEKSPTGVMLIGGIPHEWDFLLTALGRTSELSPTEDKRTAY